MELNLYQKLLDRQKENKEHYLKHKNYYLSYYYRNKSKKEQLKIQNKKIKELQKIQRENELKQLRYENN